MERYLTDEQVNEITDGLLGTCFESIQTVTESLGIDYTKLTDEDYDAIYDVVFECDNCGWWCETGEAHENNGELFCDNCMDELEEEEEEDS